MRSRFMPDLRKTLFNRFVLTAQRCWKITSRGMDHGYGAVMRPGGMAVLTMPVVFVARERQKSEERAPAVVRMLAGRGVYLSFLRTVA